jgi:predicted permease
MFGNYGNLPLALLETITKDVWPFSEDAAATQRSLAYASIFLSTASLWLWTFGPWYIKISREDPNVTSSTESEEDASAAVEEQEVEDVNVVPLSLEEEEDSHSIPMKTIATSTSTLDSARGANPSSLDAFQPRLPFRQRLVSRAQVIWQAILNSPIWSVLTPSTLGCIFAVLLLIMGPVHRLFFTPPVLVQNTPLAPITPTFSNDTFVPSLNTTVCSPIEAPTTRETKKPPLKFVADSIGSLANICVPVSLLMLGSNLFTTVKGQIMRARLQRENNGANGDSSSGSATQSVLPLSKRVLFGAVFGRLAVLPAVCFAFTWLVHKTGILPADPLVSVILAVEGCMPSAINLIILAQLQDDQLVVEQLSTILLVQYLFCTFSIFTTIALGIQMFT